MTILTVGVGQEFSTLAKAVAASKDGDTIQVQAGTYVNDFATITTKISIVGVGGMAHFVATVSPPNGKAILVTKTDVSVDHLEFSGVAVPDHNGCGIRHGGGTLTVTNCYFHNNEMGILDGGTFATDRVIVRNSEFANQTRADGGVAHQLYVGNIAYLEVQDCYFGPNTVGHQIKSRAVDSIIQNNVIDDGNGTTSYEIDLPNGGNGTIHDNAIVQGPNSQNTTIISYGEEGMTYATNSLNINDNVISNLLPTHGIGLVNTSTTLAHIDNNEIYHLPIIATGPNEQTGNTTLAAAPSIDAAHPWSSTAQVLQGGAGVDVLAGGGGDDTLIGGAGNDILIGGGGHNTFVFNKGDGSDTIFDFKSGDHVQLNGYGFADATAADAALSQQGNDVVLTLGGGETLTLRDHHVADFTAADFLVNGSGGGSGGGTGGSNAPFVLPVSGAPTTTLAAGVTTGTSGNDFMRTGGAPGQTYSGGAGDDTYYVTDPTAKINEAPGGGVDTVITWGSYTLPANVENLTAMGGSRHALTGNDGNNIISGGISGEIINGGGGNDILIGGGGADTLTGGAGHDMFVYKAIGDAGDTITDFHSGEDLLDLRDLMKSIGYAGTDPVADHHVSFVASGTSTNVMIDPDGAGPAAAVKLATLQHIAPAQIKTTDWIWH